jgi:signal transduction histidine kinase
MIDSTLCGEVGEGATLSAEVVVEADAGGQGEQADADGGLEVFERASAVAFQGEDVLAGLEDGFDALADGRQVGAVVGLVAAGGAQDGECPSGRRSTAPGPPVAVGDEARLEHVISNLVTNGFKHSPAGARVEIAADTDGDRVRVAVSDSGTGIEPEFFAHIFEPFTQAASITGRRDGLGLYIVRGLVDAMRGTIEAESTLGVGSRFTVRLERADAA